MSVSHGDEGESERMEREYLEGLRYEDKFPDDEDEEMSGERYGFGVCRRGNCIEPCGDFGGCKR